MENYTNTWKIIHKAHKIKNPIEIFRLIYIKSHHIL
jgi:hypothetical protein